jgi:hypothetical protein
VQHPSKTVIGVEPVPVAVRSQRLDPGEERFEFE